MTFSIKQEDLTSNYNEQINPMYKKIMNTLDEDSKTTVKQETSIWKDKRIDKSIKLFSKIMSFTIKQENSKFDFTELIDYEDQQRVLDGDLSIIVNQEALIWNVKEKDKNVSNRHIKKTITQKHSTWAYNEQNDCAGEQNIKTSNENSNKIVKQMLMTGGSEINMLNQENMKNINKDLDQIINQEIISNFWSNNKSLLSK